MRLCSLINCTGDSGQTQNIYKSHSIELEPQNLFWNTSNTHKELYDTIVRIINPTNKPVKINDIEVSCDCLSVNFNDSVIPPGESRPMDINFDISEISGYFERKIYIRYDSRKKVKILNINGNVN